MREIEDLRERKNTKETAKRHGVVVTPGGFRSYQMGCADSLHEDEWKKITGFDH